MNDLKNLLSSDATEFERELLAAVAGERPSPELQLRMQSALGLGSAPLQAPASHVLGSPELGGTHAAAGSANHWGSGLLKAVLGVGAALVAGVVAVRSTQPTAPRPAPPIAAAAPEPQERPASLEVPAASAPSTDMSRELREEVQLLDQVRLALGESNAPQAQALLDRYAARFPEGALAREAAVLRSRTAQLSRTNPR